MSKLVTVNKTDLPFHSSVLLLVLDNGLSDEIRIINNIFPLTCWHRTYSHVFFTGLKRRQHQWMCCYCKQQAHTGMLAVTNRSLWWTTERYFYSGYHHVYKSVCFRTIEQNNKNRQESEKSGDYLMFRHRRVFHGLCLHNMAYSFSLKVACQSLNLWHVQPCL